MVFWIMILWPKSTKALRKIITIKDKKPGVFSNAVIAWISKWGWAHHIGLVINNATFSVRVASYVPKGIFN